MDSPSTIPQATEAKLIFWVDRQMKIRRVSDNVGAALGHTAEALIGQALETLFTETNRHRIEQASQGLRMLVAINRADGRRQWVLYSVSSPEESRDGLSEHTAILIGPDSLDEFFEERLQEERRTAHQELLGHISHNVNNLLTTILSPAQLLLESTRDPDAREDILDILQATQRARALLREMYRAVRFEAESVDSIQLEPLLADIAGDPNADSLNIQLSLARLPGVLGVREGLRTIMHTLLKNASEAGATEVNISAQDEGERVLLAVRDNGKGINDASLSRLFEPFATAKSRVGAGLSLATTRTRLLGWGASIAATSKVGAGSTFTISLQTAPRPVHIETTGGGRVLLVEDERIIARTLRRIFSAHHIDTALNASAALQMFLPGEYDAVLIDLGLPEMPGDELAKVLHNRDPAVSMLMLTGWMLNDDDPRMKLFDDRIQKPIESLTRVRAKLNEAIERTRGRREES